MCATAELSWKHISLLFWCDILRWKNVWLQR